MSKRLPAGWILYTLFVPFVNNILHFPQSRSISVPGWPGNWIPMDSKGISSSAFTGGVAVKHGYLS